jgi:exopolyphosphatase/guanosine-5'-triphosphate,3'-diphosphate pyrophosphatase
VPESLAIIDLGTNTFHLLIAEKKHNRYEIVHREKLAVKIGAGGINKDVITNAGLARAVDALIHFKSRISELPADRVFAFGTSAFRNAANMAIVLEHIKTKSGIDITILAGDQEAEFIYYGIRSALDLGVGKSMIVDIGGGSVEFIIGNNEEIFWKKSIEIGGQRLLEQFHKNDPITTAEILLLDNYLSGVLPGLLQAIHNHQPETMVGSSGTFDTLSEIYCRRQGIVSHEGDPETPLSIEGFHEIYRELITKDRVKRLAIPGMIEMRVDMIVVACHLIRFLLDRHPFSRIRVSGYSLKEGALYHLNSLLS